MNKRKLLILLSLLLLICIASILLCVVLSSNKSEDILNSSDNPVSYISYPTSNLPENEDKGFIFKNISEFQVSKLINLAQNFCDMTSYPTVPPIRIDIENYSFKDGDNYMSAKVFNNMNLYVNNSKDISDAYDLYSRLLNGEVTVENSPNSYDYAETLPHPCDTSVSQSMYLKKINYQGTDNAYLILFGGSTQSVVNHTYFPIRLLIVSKIENNFVLLEASDFDYELVTKSNHLEDCEINSEYDYKYIDEHHQEGLSCAINVFNEDLDQDKLNQMVDKITTTFSLE